MTGQSAVLDRYASHEAKASENGTTSPPIGEAEERARSAPAALPAREVRYRCAEYFLPILRHLNASLLVSTYQAGKVAVIAPGEVHDEKLSVSFANFDQPMGLAVTPERLAVGTRRQVWFHKAAHEFAGRIREGERGSTCYVARSSLVTGNIHVHDMAWAGSELWVANTLFSCLSTLDDAYNFVPQWKPPFISALAPQDRCHLNGLAVDEGGPKYVTALAQTDGPQGWRPTKAESGCVLDVASGEPVAAGLCMPHSPRLYDGKLWVLNSGRGELNTVEAASGQLETIDRVPGYTRGLAFAGQFAFVGMSKIRETAVYGGLPIGERPDGLRCGVVVVDLQTGKSIAWFEFTTGVEEVFDVKILPGFGQLVLCGPHINEDEQHEVWIIPSFSAPQQTDHG
jgi:uncharacterized protein (TIGR03032 family)